jgi:3-hydroxyisobutyrate dehydrogenase-like beta-hydroxyacid dehydrogenase
MNQMITKDPVGFLGLGKLGAPIAQNLVTSGVPLTVWNRTPSKAEALVQAGAKVADLPSKAIPRGGVVFTILWDDASLEEMVRSPGFLEALGPGGVHVSMTTVTPSAAQTMAALHAEHGITYVEAPIFGIPAHAVARKLTLCVGGPASAKERVRPLFDAAGAERIFDFGETIGVATATKLVGNFLIVSGFVALQEAFDVLRGNGIDPKATLEMVTTTIAATPGNQRFAAALLSGQVPTSAIPAKDIGLFRRFAERAHAPALLSERMQQILGTETKRST